MIKNIINRKDLLPEVLVSVRAPVNVLGRNKLRDSLYVVDWHMPVSISPTKYAISVRSDDSVKGMISKAGNFVLNFMGPEHEELVLSCEELNGLFVDLFELFMIAKSDADMVESPRIKEAKEVLECRVEQELESGDHTIFVAQVVGPRV